MYRVKLVITKNTIPYILVYNKECSVCLYLYDLSGKAQLRNYENQTYINVEEKKLMVKKGIECVKNDIKRKGSE